MNIYQRDLHQTPEIFRLIKGGDNAAAMAHLGRNPEEVCLRGWMDATPLHIAVSADNLEMVQFLAEHGADLNASRTGASPFPLSWARSRAVAEYLLDRGARLHATALEDATRSDAPEVIGLLLDRGASWEPRSPPYLFCKSVAAIKAYLDHGTTLDGRDDHGRTLLHHLVWSERSEAFDLALARGAPWRKDLLGLDPYYFGRSGGRRRMMEHIQHRYPHLVARTVRAVKATEIHFQDVSFLLPCAVGGNAVIVWTRDERLGRIEIPGDRWAVTRAVHVNVCHVQSFCIDPDGDIVLPAGDDVLLVLDAVTLEVKRTIPVAPGVDIEDIHYLPGRRMYLARGDSYLHLLGLDFERIKTLRVDAPCSGVTLNGPATLVCTRHFNYEASRVLHSLDDDLRLSPITDLEAAGHGAVRSVTLHDHGAIVTFEKIVVAYRQGESGLVESWRSPLDGYPSTHDRSSAVLLGPDCLLVGRGMLLLRLDARTGAQTGVATLDLAGEIKGLHQDPRGERLIVRGGGMKLVRLDGINWR